jgi:hypothetical protein
MSVNGVDQRQAGINMVPVDLCFTFSLGLYVNFLP